MKKIDQILKVAKDLFWKYGIKRVTVEEICKEAQVSKMTFYKYFNNKIELVKYIYRNLIDLGMNKYKAIMNSNIPFVDKVRKSIDLKMEQTEALSQEFYNDLINSDDPEIKELFNKTVQQNIQIILNDYLEAQRKNEIRNDIKPEFILYFLNHMFEMANDKQLGSLYNTPNEMIMELTNFFFYGILPRDNE